MQITIISHQILNEVVKFVKIFCLQLLKINLNTVPEAIMFSICNYVLIKPIYDIIIEDVIVNCLNIHVIGKDYF